MKTTAHSNGKGPSQKKPAKSVKTTIPEPQRSRIIARHLAGESVRKIARKERRDRETVTRIVRSDEVIEYVRKMREQYLGLAPQALDAVQHDLQHFKDGRLARAVLNDIGVIPSPEERNVVAAQANPLDESKLTEGQRLALMIGKAMDERKRLFGIEPPTRRFETYRKIEEELQLLRKKSSEELNSSDPAVWSGLKNALLKENAIDEQQREPSLDDE